MMPNLQFLKSQRILKCKDVAIKKKPRRIRYLGLFITADPQQIEAGLNECEPDASEIVNRE